MRAASIADLAKARSLFDAGRLDAADALVREVLAREPDAVEAQVLAGVIAARTGRAAPAEAHLERALGLDPNQFDALAWLAKLKHAQRDFEGAIGFLQRAVEVKEDDSAALALLGICHMSLGQARLAVACFAKVVALEPRSGQGYFNLGMAQRMQNRSHEAAEAFLAAAKYAPERPENFLQAFKQLWQVSRRAEAVEYLEKGLRLHPRSAALAESLALAYGRLGRSGEAEAIFRQRAGEPATALSYATWLQEEGRFDDSVRILRNLLAHDPASGAAYRMLAEAKAFEADGGSLLDAMLAIYRRPDLDDRNRMHLAYGIGKAYDFAGDYERAMRHFDAANALAYRIYPVGKAFDRASTQADPDIMAGVYSRDLLARLEPYGSPSETPIFIVGMIRSGTTLLDRIVSSHPRVVSAGELPFWSVEGDRVHRKWREAPDPADLAPLAASYLSVLEGGMGAGAADRVTDKMPLNFRHLGLMSAAFPRAKIVHIRRNPLDTCLSIYTTFFGGGPDFAYNPENIVVHYEAYLRFMAHWREVLPADRFYELDYEDLVANPEPAIRGVIDFCGLEWDEACLAHSRNEQAVSTPSRWQARQPIYASSVERWRRYEPWLGAFLRLRDVDPGR